MYGRGNRFRSQPKTKRIIVGTSTDVIVNVGDWALTQDEDGNLVAHHVFTGKRVVIGEPGEAD